MKKSLVRLVALGSLLSLRAVPVLAEPAPAPAVPAPAAPAAATPPPAAPPAPAASPEAPAPVASAPAPLAPPPAAPAPVPDAVATAPADLPPEAVAPAPEASKPKPPPYSLPWQLRSVVPANAVRSDTSIAFYEGPTTRGGTAVVSMLSASYKVIPELAPLVRVGLVSNAPPTDKSTRTNLTNPVLGVLYGPKLHPNFKLGLFFALTLPIGSGGGNEPHPQAPIANQVGAATRSMMDNAMFAVNYLTLFPGVGAAYVGNGFTFQVEATLLELLKTRGPDAADKSNTNFTMGAHAGYFIIPQLSVGTEIRHQRWLSTPTQPNVKADKTGTLRDTTTWAIGPRAHVQLGKTMWLRPGLSFSLPLDNPLANGKGASHFKMLQIDIPFVF